MRDNRLSRRTATMSLMTVSRHSTWDISLFVAKSFADLDDKGICQVCAEKRYSHPFGFDYYNMFSGFTSWSPGRFRVQNYKNFLIYANFIFVC